MADSRINKKSVFQAILNDRTHTIWTPCLALERMGIERYPHQPTNNRLAMRTVLEDLCELGALTERSRVHSHGVFKETAYELEPDRKLNL